MQTYITDRSEIEINFVYPDFKEEIFDTLRKITNITTDGLSEIDAVKKICGYVHLLFPHDGLNTPSSYDPITIINEAKQGKSFRCVEYSFIGVSLLWAYGIPARSLALKTKDCETREMGAGHVVLEFWSKQFQKWIMIDIQHATIMRNESNTYLSAFELLQSITKEDSLIIEILPDAKFTIDELGKEYLPFMSQYLYFFDTPLETAISLEKIQTKKKGLVMLAPLNVEIPKVFQNTIPMNIIAVTHSVIDFYPTIK